MIYKNNLEHCTLCPRNCNAKRYEKKGICRASEKIEVSSIIIHKGEEPVLSGKHGILNVFLPIVISDAFIVKIIKLVYIINIQQNIR